MNGYDREIEDTVDVSGMGQKDVDIFRRGDILTIKGEDKKGK